MVEKKSGHYIKIIRTYRGREFASNDFLIFCNTDGIKMKFTTSNTLQKNAIAGRKNRTIMEMERIMMKDKNLPNEYWAKVVSYASYILIRSPT